MSLTYKKMNLFDAPKDVVLCHAGNSKGIWGSGIAAEFKKRFPLAYKNYNEQCIVYPMIAEFDFTIENNYKIATLITSKDYGYKKDSIEEILINTTIALNELCRYLQDNDDSIVYSNKFNSGLFNVPWEKTEAILKVFIKRYHLNWVICDPNLKEENKDIK